MKKINNKTSEKSFAITFAIISLIVSFFVFQTSLKVFSILISFSFIMLVLGFYFPKSLKYPNLVWFKIGIFIAKITTPIILFMIFFLFLTPFSILLRIFGVKMLDAKIPKNTDSFWVNKDNKNNMMEQF